MKRIRLILVALLAFASMGLLASAASALEWLVEGKALAANETVEANALGTSVLKTELTGGTKLEILCDSATATGVAIPKVTGESAGGVLFDECKIVTPSACKVAPSLKTKALAFELIGNELLSVKPKVGKVFIEIEIEDCAGEGAFEVKGEVACEDKGALLEKPRNCKFEEGVDQGLTFGAKPAVFVSTFTFALTGIHKTELWGIK